MKEVEKLLILGEIKIIKIEERWFLLNAGIQIKISFFSEFFNFYRIFRLFMIK